jgi:hypothetical protein
MLISDQCNQSLREKRQCSGFVNISYGSGSVDHNPELMDPDPGGQLITDLA